MRKFASLFAALIMLLVANAAREQNSWEVLSQPSNGSWKPYPEGGYVGSWSSDLFCMAALPTGVIVFNNSNNIWNYSEVDSSLDFVPFSFAACSDGSFLVDGGYSSNRIIRSSDQGLTWSSGSGLSVALNLLGPMIGDHRGTAYAASGNRFYRSFDNGSNWEQASSFYPSVGFGYVTVKDFAVDSSGNVFASIVYVDSPIYHPPPRQYYSDIIESNDSGKSWHSLEFHEIFSGSSGNLNYDIEYNDSSNSIFVFNGSIYRYDSNKWQLITPLSNVASVNRILGIGHRYVIAATQSGIYYSNDSGNTWAQDSIINFECMNIVKDGTGTLLASTIGGLYRSVNSTLNSIRSSSGQSPSIFLNQNSPNPFPQSTTISFTLPAASYISLDLFDATGRQVERIASGYFGAGEHDVSFTRGSLPDGVYFYRLEANGSVQTQALVIEE